MRPYLILAAVAVTWAAPANASSFQTFGASKKDAAPSVIVYAAQDAPKLAAEAAAKQTAVVTPKPAAVWQAGERQGSCKPFCRPSPSVIALGPPRPLISSEMTAAITEKLDRNGGMGPLLIRGGIAAFGPTQEQPASAAAAADAGKSGETTPAAAQPADPGEEITEAGPAG